jgi:hypothetical protein
MLDGYTGQPGYSMRRFSMSRRHLMTSHPPLDLGDAAETDLSTPIINPNVWISFDSSAPSKDQNSLLDTS